MPRVSGSPGKFVAASCMILTCQCGGPAGGGGRGQSRKPGPGESRDPGRRFVAVSSFVSGRNDGVALAGNFKSALF